MSDHSSTNLAANGGKFIVSIDSDLKPLVPKFLSIRKKEAVDIREALARHDFHTAGKIAHGMKGAGGMYGFERIADLAAAIEEAAKTGSAASIETDLALLAAYLEHVQIVFA